MRFCSKSKRLLFAAVVQVVSYLPMPSDAQGIIRHRDCIYNPFRPDSNGSYTSTYSCDNSDIIGWAIAFNCVNNEVNESVPDLEEMSRSGMLGRRMPGSPGTPMKWKGWETVNGTGYESLFWKVCSKHYTDRTKTKER